jgi:xanthine dehydrogenase small subunit
VIEFELNGRPVTVADDRSSLLDALREELGIRSVKDGCSPQGQCGCCTVWVDGRPRVACVTPARRIAGRHVTTIEGLPDADGWAARFCAEGATQCGFCTPGIIMRLAALDETQRSSAVAIDRALVAHLCRCTGWQSIVSAATAGPLDAMSAREAAGVERQPAAQRAAIEGGTEQVVAPGVALGRGGFADDTAPEGALVALRGAGDDWVTGATLAAARAAAGKVQGRRTTAPARWPIELPPGDWVRTLRTTWVEPAYLEPDASWCAPGGIPATPLANGGAFGGKLASPVGRVARRLADEHGVPVRVQYAREDVVRHGAKRSPLAIGLRADGSGAALVARPTDPAEEAPLVELLAQRAPDVEVQFVDVDGPPVSTGVRAAVWAEVLAVRASLEDGGDPTVPAAVPFDRVVAPSGATAAARIVEHDGAEAVQVAVRCGRPLDEVVLRSYCVGAAHMALGMVRSEYLAVDDDGAPLDLTIRSFGILRASDMPSVEVEVEADDGESVVGSEAVFAAVLAAAWRCAGYPDRWPVAAM